MRRENPLNDRDPKNENGIKPAERSGAQQIGSSAAVSLGVLPDLVGFNLRIAYNRVVAAFGRRFSGFALAPIQFAALEFVSRNPGTSQKEIAKYIDTRPSVLVGPLERLEQRKWIVRRRSAEDRRRARVFVTESGEAELERARGLISEVETAVAARFARGEREELIRLLRKISDGTNFEVS